MDLLIGCPVLRRAWIIDTYLAYADLAADEAGYTPSYLFVGQEHDPTMARIDEWAKTNRRRVFFEPFAQEDRDDDRRDWNENRYAVMTDVRNALLAAVRKLEPELFFSVDSDILLHPLSLLGALEGVGRFDAIGTKTYLTEVGTECPNYAQMVGGGLHRIDFEGFAPVQVIMAIKLMTPNAYHVDYVTHHQGEDIGWSLNCGDEGITLGWDGRHPSKHIMVPEQLDRVDPRVGW